MTKTTTHNPTDFNAGYKQALADLAKDLTALEIPAKAKLEINAILMAKMVTR